MKGLFHNENPYSRLYLVGDNAPWVLSEEVREIYRLATQLGIQTEMMADPSPVHMQSIFYINRYSLFETLEHPGENRVGMAYFHGTPGSGYPEFDKMFSLIAQHHDRISRIQVTYGEMERLMLLTGIDRRKVFRIPLAVAVEAFPFRTPESRLHARSLLGIPAHATVIGSFQKDGSGWNEGLEPKLIKGPDVLLRVLAMVKPHIPNLMVLLTGPSRGFVKHGLEQLGIPHRHLHLEKYRDIAACYHAIDVYVVPSRQEGGPKAVLEAMASGVPLVTTRVGQAMDLVQHRFNGWMVDPDNVDGLTACILDALGDPVRSMSIVREARLTAEQHSYDRQLPLWQKFFEGFVQTNNMVNHEQ
jgi:glycosyltransferase involved in cell wall biosynthesis